MSSVFISYSQHDRAFAKKLNRDLKSSGINTWIDYEKIDPGDSLIERIDHGLQSNAHVLIVISASYLTSSWAQWETNTAMSAALDGRSNAVIPILLEDVWMDVPQSLRQKTFVDFRQHANVLEYRSSMKRLLAVLRRGQRPLAVRTGRPSVLVSGGRDPHRDAKAFQLSYQLGHRLGERAMALRSGCAAGVDEWFCRGATSALQEAGKNPTDHLICYSVRGRESQHDYGQQQLSAYSRRSEGVPEMITESEIVVLLGGSSNTQYLGVLALLEDRVVLPVAATGGAAADLHSIILSRYERIYGDLLPNAQFRSLAAINAPPDELATRVLKLIDQCCYC